MAGTIKGITVQINGDCTNLQKALSEVNNKGKDLNTELSQVTRLLKFDPSNVTLLAQKQQLLSEAIANSSSKLDTLKNVQAQVDQQFQSGDIGEEQYRAFEREIAACEGKLGSLSKQQDELGSTSSSASAEVKDLGSKLDDTGTKAISFGDILKANIVSDAIVGGVKAIGSAVSSLASGLIGTASSAAEYADNVATLATQTGLATDTIQGMQYAAELLDVDVEAQTKGLSKVVKAIGSATAAGQDYITISDGLSVSLYDANGKLKSSEDVYYDAIDALGSMTDSTEQEVAAQSLFGKSYQDMMPLIKAGSSGLKELSAQAEANGYILSGSALDALNSYKDSLDTLNNQKTAFTNAVGAVMAPALKIFTDSATDATVALTQLANGSISSEEFSAKISSVVTGLTSKINEALPTVLQVGGSIISAIGTGIINALPLILSAAVPILTTLLNAIVAALPTLAGTGVSIIMELVTAIVAALPSILSAGMQIIASLILGISQAMPDLIPEAVQVILQLVQTFVDNLPSIINAGLQLLAALGEGIINAIPALVDQLPQVIKSILTYFTENLPQILETGIDILVALINGIVNAIPQLISMLPTIISTIINTLSDHMPEIIEAGIEITIALIDGLIQAIPQLIASLPQIINSILDTFADVDWLELGRNIVYGLWDGIQELAGWLWGKVTGWADNIVSSVKDALGIHSPSTVMADQVGRYLPEGVAQGIDDNAFVVSDAMADINYQLGDIAAAGSSISNSSSTVTTNNYYNATPSSPNSKGTTVTVSIGDIVLENVQDTDGLANAIVKELPAKVMQKIYAH